MDRRGHHRGAEILQGRSLSPFLRRRSRALPGKLPVADAAALILSLISSAFLMAVAVGSPGHAWIGWVGLVPLFLVIRALSPPRAMLCGALWGFWLSVFSVSGTDTAVPFTSWALALLVLAPAFYAYVGAQLTRCFGFRPLLLAFGWAGLELALQPLGLRGGVLAGTQENAGIAHSLCGSLGYLCVASFIAFANAKLLGIVSEIHLATLGTRSSIRLDARRESVNIPSFPNCAFLAAAFCGPRGPPG